MGLTINDTITLENGMTITGAYLSFNRQHVSIIPGQSPTLSAEGPDPSISYTACATYSIWASQQACQNKLKPIQTGMIDYAITTAQTQTALHTLLYNYIKTNIYKNTTDVIEPVTPGTVSENL